MTQQHFYIFLGLHITIVFIATNLLQSLISLSLPHLVIILCAHDSSPGPPVISFSLLGPSRRRLSSRRFRPPMPIFYVAPQVMSPGPPQVGPPRPWAGVSAPHPDSTDGAPRLHRSAHRGASTAGLDPDDPDSAFRCWLCCAGMGPSDRTHTTSVSSTVSGAAVVGLSLLGRPAKREECSTYQYPSCLLCRTLKLDATLQRELPSLKLTGGRAVTNMSLLLMVPHFILMLGRMV